MIETTEWILIMCIMIVLSGIFGGVWSFVGRYLADRRINNIEADLESLQMTILSRKGEQARSENQALVAEAEQKIIGLLGKGITKENISELAPYASVLPKLLKKYGMA